MKKLIATYLEWKDISKKSCFEIAKEKQRKPKRKYKNKIDLV